VGGHRYQLGLDPEASRGAARKLLSAHLREVAPGGETELRRQGLDQHRHQIRDEDPPAERVTVLRAAGDVRREVARVDVGDTGDERGSEEGNNAEGPRKPAKSLVYLPVVPGGERICARR